MIQPEITQPSLKLERPQYLAIVSLSLALVAVSFAPIFIRLGETELGPNATVLNRLLVFLFVFGIGRLATQRFAPEKEINEEEDKISMQQWLLLGSVGIITVLSLSLWAISLQYTTVAKCMLLNNLTPIFTSLGSWLIFGKRFDRKFLIGMIIALSGAIALGFEDLTAADGLLIGDLFALLSAVFLGIYFLIVEQLRFRFSATTILLWRCGIGSMALLPIVLFTEVQLFPHTKVAIFAVMGLGLISEGLGQRLLADCMDKLSSSFVALFLLLEPIVSAVLAWLIFVEKFSPLTWIGFVVVLSGIYLAQTSQTASHES